MGTMPIYIAIPPVDAQAEQPIYLHIHLLEGGPMRFDTSVIANEHWDDSLPQRVDGKDPFSNWYRGLSTTTDGKMALYNEDTLQKREDLLQWLDEADYIVMSSNRLYGSIPRLPMRFPMTIAYYEAMFDGSLGFELLAEFVSFPSLGPCQFPDQEAPFPIPEPRYTNSLPCSVPFPPAEEAFSVYDHPRVLIFAKTQDYSREEAEALLPPTLLANVEPMTALEATRGKKAETHTLLMDPRLEAVQEQGGTWSKLFPPNALQNRAHAMGQFVAIVLWWLLLTALGWLAFPWLTLAFPALQDRGYGLARAVGLLLWAYPAWLLAALRVMPHTRLWLWIVFLGFALCTALLVYVRRVRLWTFVREHWRALLRIEVIFAVLYLFWVLVRYLNPDLWHPVTGGEKPMDFAYLNAVIKSTWFPPYDPWFAGGIMNYYYFGFVLAGSLTEALGIMPSVAYNLIVPSFFAMTGVGAYTLAANLAGGSEVRRRRAGILGLFLVLLLGNLGEVRLIFNGLEELGGVEFTSLIPGYPALVSAIVGLWKMLVQGQMLRFRPEWWYWDATRVIPFEPGGAGPINEFPLFSFLYADLHAHMMAYPLTQVALGVALQWGLGKSWAVNTKNRIFWGRLGLSLGIGALAAGALRATNTWDYPTYLALMIVAFLMNLFYTLRKEQADASRVMPPWIYLQLIVPVLLVVLAELLFRPYTRNYAMAYSSFKLWNGMKTPLGIYLVMHGHFLFPLVILAGLQGSRVFQGFWGKRPTDTDAAIPSDNVLSEKDNELHRDRWLFGERLLSIGVVIVGVIALVATLVFLLDVAVAWLAVPLGTVAALIVLSPEYSMRMRLLWFWVGTALALSLLVEVLVLSGDIGRMNTVFKFYLQVWMLLALSSAVAIERLVGKALSFPPLGEVSDRYPAWFPDIVFGGIAVLLLAAALYPLLAIPAKVRDRWNNSAPHTLDGARFIAYVTQHEHTSTIPLITDYKVIRWFQNHVAHTPVIIEGQAEREYLWGNRVSVHTGLPTVAAWRWHQVQQRMIMPSGTVEKRQFDIRDFYNTTNPERAMDILRQYEVKYVVLTPYERAYMVPEGEAKFATLVAQERLEVVYRDEDAIVYRVSDAPSPLSKDLKK
jgi:YYY domain-containing protein